jgi:peptidoglycan hydrolase-like protein with peptidoglycan-binding domain
MNPQQRNVRRSKSQMRPEFKALFVVAVAATLLCVLIAIRSGSPTKHADAQGSSPALAVGASAVDASAVDAGAPTSTAAVSAGNDAVGADPAAALDGADPNTLTSGGTAATGACTMTQRSARQGDTGADITCIQKALIAGGFLAGAPSGTFDIATVVAVKAVQTKRDMFVDGIVGRETAISLVVWPDEASLVVHTPKPAAGAKDLLGYPLSSVAVSGPDAPPLPPNSGSGKRVVYSRTGQRAWAIGADNVVIRSWLVSGSKYNNEEPGVHTVYSRSETSTAWNGKAILPHMVRYQKTFLGNIGFHGIPIHVADGTAYMTEDQLGNRLSGGCQRQANSDANFMWAFAQIGTTIVVI